MTNKIVRLETQVREGREIESLLASDGYKRHREATLTRLLNGISGATDDAELGFAAHELRAFLKQDSSLKQLVDTGSRAAKDLEKDRP